MARRRPVDRELEHADRLDGLVRAVVIAPDPAIDEVAARPPADSRPRTVSVPACPPPRGPLPVSSRRLSANTIVCVGVQHVDGERSAHEVALRFQRTSSTIGAPCSTFSIGLPFSSLSVASRTRALTSGIDRSPPFPSLAEEVQRVVAACRLLGLADVAQLAVVQQHRPLAQVLDGLHVVGHQHDRLARCMDVHGRRRMHFWAKAASPTASTSSIEHDVGVGLDHHGEAQADHHSRGVVLELAARGTPGSSAKSSTASNRCRASRLDSPIRTPLRIALSRAVISGSKPTPSSMNGARRPAMRTLPAVGRIDAGQDLEQRALARSVLAHDPEELALVDVEGDVAQRLQLAVLDAGQRVATRSLSESTRWSGMRNALARPLPRSPSTGPIG